MPSLDTETTGLDFHHGTIPFFVTACNKKNGVTYWEWDVDPLTRRPIIPEGDIQSIARYLHMNDEPFILQNGKFDVHALKTIGLWKHYSLEKFWKNYHDTLIAGHVLESNARHNLTALSFRHLKINIKRFEDRLEDACKAARRVVRLKKYKKEFDGWRYAKHGRPDMPSVRKGKGGGKKNVQADSAWKNDTWLPRAMAKQLEHPQPKEDCTHDWLKDFTCSKCKGHHWWTITAEYANTDSEVTCMLWERMEQKLRKQDLWEIYLIRLQSMKLAYTLEDHGITGSVESLDTLEQQYREEAEAYGRRLVSFAADDGVPLELPKSGISPSIRRYCFDTLKFPVVERSVKTGDPTLGKEARSALLNHFSSGSREEQVLHTINDKVKRDTLLNFMRGYRRYWINKEGEDLFVLHPSLNPVGSDTLRWSSSNPNSQNIAKQDTACRRCDGDKEDKKTCKKCKGTGYDYRSLRVSFGPAPGREWYSCDAKNLELRIPFYESNEKALIELFEKPDEPPYYGSNHLANFHAVYPDIWGGELGTICNDCCKGKVVDITRIGPHCKKKFAATWYQWDKNGGFAKQYGGQRRKVDSTFRRDGAFDLMEAKFANLAKLNKKQIQFAEKHGYVETIPDRTVNPRRGYPLYCTKTDNGGILPTVPLSYHVQGTAMYWTLKAMIRCQAQLDIWNEKCGIPNHYRITLQVHDELVFDFPKGYDPVQENERLKKDPKGFKRPDCNLHRVRILMNLMSMGGDDIGIPTPVGCEYHVNNWAEGVSL